MGDLGVWTADNEDWVVASTNEEARDVFCHHMGWEPDTAPASDGSRDFGTHADDWDLLPDDKVLPWAEECPEHHTAGAVCPRACDEHFVIHTRLTCGEHVKKSGRGYLGSANT